MKKILLYTDTPIMGGAELQMFLLAKFLNKENYAPLVVLSNSRDLDKLSENFQKEQIPVIRLNTFHKHDPRHLTGLKKIVREHKPDILHLHIWNPASCRYAYYSVGKEMPIIITEHDPYPLSKVKTWFKKITLKKVKKIITVSNENRKLIEKLYPNYKDKIEVVHNGIDTIWWKSQLLRFTENERKKIKEEIFNVKEDSLIITSVAQLHERKGLDILIKVMPEIVKKYSNIKLIIIGTGPEKNNLQELINELNLQSKIKMLGFQKEIPKFLMASDIFVLPSRREAFGLAILEAMITKLPVIASNKGGIPEVIKQGQTGILFETPEELQESLLWLIQSAKSRNTLAQKAYMTLLEEYHAKKMAENYEKIYEKIIN